MHNHFGVARGLKNRPVLLQPRAHFKRINEVAVVRQRNLPFVALHHDRLRIQQRRVARGGVARVANRKRACNSSQNIRIEDIRYQAHGFVQL